MPCIHGATIATTSGLTFALASEYLTCQKWVFIDEVKMKVSSGEIRSDDLGDEQWRKLCVDGRALPLHVHLARRQYVPATRGEEGASW